MTTQTIQSIQTVSAPDLGHLKSGISRAVSAILAGARAGHDWRRMSAMTDAALAREGISRDQIARAVLERNFR